MPFDIHFLRPYALLLLPLVLLCWLLLLRRLPLTDAWQQMLAPHLYQQLLTVQQTKTPRHWMWPLLLLLGIVAAAGPSWQKLPQPAFQLKRATVLVLDMSMSMRATDIKPNRVTQARFKALDYAKAQLEGEMALLTFAGDAYVISPLTPDHNNISLLLPDLKPEIMPVQGSDFAGALKLADQLLQQAGYVKGDIIFFTDGFDSQQFTQIRDQLNGFRHRVSVLAFGQTDGAPIQLENGELLKDTRGSIVLPKVPLSQLRELSALTGGAFAQSSFDDSDISKLLALPALTLNEEATPSAMQGDQWQDAGVYLCYLLLILAALALRQQQLLVLPLLLMLWPQPVPAADAQSAVNQANATTAEAASAPGWHWQDLWQSRNEQAREAYAAGDYAGAQAKFKDPLWQGNAAYRAGDYAGAASLFQQDKSAAGLFNLGNSLALQQQYQQALAAYQQAAQQQADLPGVQDNIKLMQKLLEQQQDQQEQQSKDQQQSQDQQQDGEQKDGEQKDGQEQQDQQSQQQSQDQQQNEQNKQDGAESDPTQQQQTQQQKQQLQQAEADQQSEKPDQQQQAIEQAWPNASPEQSQQLENLLRKVQDEPSLLLKNKMLLEYQKRQQQAIPRGVQQEW